MNPVEYHESRQKCQEFFEEVEAQQQRQINMYGAAPNDAASSQKSKVFCVDGEQRIEPDLHIISFDEYFSYVNIRKKRIKIFLVTFTLALSLLGLGAFLAVYGLCMSK